VSVRLSACLSQVGVLPRCLNLGLCKQRHTEGLSEIPVGLPTIGAPNRGGVGQKWWFSTNILLYLRNGATSGHSSYRRLIRTYMLDWMVLFPVTFVVGGDRDFRFCRKVHRSKFYSADNKLSLKGAWLGLPKKPKIWRIGQDFHANHLNFLRHLSYLWSGWSWSCQILYKRFRQKFSKSGGFGAKRGFGFATQTGTFLHGTVCVLVAGDWKNLKYEKIAQ